MENSKIDNVQLDGIDHNDAPDYCDAFIVSADYDGIEMNDEQIDEINNDQEFIYDQVINQIQ
mgnify:CR=1 FL=1